MQLAGSKNTLILVSILLVTFIFIAGIFLYTPPTKTTPSTKTIAPNPTVKPAISFDYPLTSSQKCKLQLIYPKAWNANINPSQNEGNPNYANKDYNRICILFSETANPSIIDRSGKSQANVTIAVQQTIKGTKVSSIPINDIDTYILASEKAAGIKATNTETVLLGGAKGKYFEITTLPLPSNYVFVIDDVLHTFSWNKEYSGDRRTDLYPFFAIIIQNSHFDQK